MPPYRIIFNFWCCQDHIIHYVLPHKDYNFANLAYYVSLASYEILDLYYEIDPRAYETRKNVKSQIHIQGRGAFLGNGDS